jgi:hypothetical protein
MLNYDSGDGRQASTWFRKNFVSDSLRSAAMESASFRRSASDIGVKARATSMLRSMNSGFGIPRLARLTGIERAYVSKPCPPPRT